MTKIMTQLLTSHLVAEEVNSVKSAFNSVVEGWMDPSDDLCSDVMMKLSVLLQELEKKAVC